MAGGDALINKKSRRENKGGGVGEREGRKVMQIQLDMEMLILVLSAASLILITCSISSTQSFFSSSLDA